jgi:DNA polymerase-3 subunit epsilon
MLLMNRADNVMTKVTTKLIFVDLETTGANHHTDKITEIGIVEVEGDQVRRWSTLVNPGMSIPPFIQNLTGIDNDMVASAPAFDSLIEELLPRLSGGLFVAHNVRFDYGFLRNAFKAAGHAWRSDILCTVKLSRQLFPKEAKHNLDSLVTRHGLIAEARHRALADADLLWQFWSKMQREIEPEVFHQALTHLLQRPSLPPHIDPAIVDDMPNTCGVYYFYGENEALLYVGKSVHLRARVLAHFAADLTDVKEQRMAQQIRRVEWKETAGELGALLEEARVVKHSQPLHNRRLRRQRELCSWQLRPAAGDYLYPALSYASELDFGQAEHLYGLYATRKKADEALRELAQSHDLCLVMLGLEQSAAPDKPCFARQLQRCRGACVGAESPIRHQARLEAALAPSKVVRWPFAGAIGLHETSGRGQTDIHVIHNWCWLGSARTEAEVPAILAAAPQAPAFDLDTYKILRRPLSLGLLPLTQFGPAASSAQ